MTLLRPGPPSTPPASTALIEAACFPEPLLLFAGDGLHVDPKAGIARYGPRSWTASGRHPTRLRVGFVGTPDLVEAARSWMGDRAEGVSGDENNPEFPGWMPDRGFFSSLEWDDAWDEELGQAELRKVLEIRAQKDRFEEAVALFEEKLRLLAERDSTPDLVVFHRRVLGATVLRDRQLCVPRFANGFIVVKDEGGPTDDKPDVQAQGMGCLARLGLRPAPPAARLRPWDRASWRSYWRSWWP